METKIIEKAALFVTNSMANAESGHNWAHTHRVWQYTKKIGPTVKANMLIAELGALFHDIADHKFNHGDEEAGAKKTQEFLNSLHLDTSIIQHVADIVRNVSFSKKNNNKSSFDSLELRVVQDADRLDALGAIGIARTFHYGGYRNTEIYNPEILPNTNGAPTTINHFYEKLLLLKDMMNTDLAKELATAKHEFMKEFLDRFYKEWNSES